MHICINIDFITWSFGDIIHESSPGLLNGGGINLRPHVVVGQPGLVNPVPQLQQLLLYLGALLLITVLQHSLYLQAESSGSCTYAHLWIDICNSTENYLIQESQKEICPPFFIIIYCIIVATVFGESWSPLGNVLTPVSLQLLLFL